MNTDTAEPAAAEVKARCLADPTRHGHRYTAPGIEIIEALPAMSDLAGLPRERPNPPVFGWVTPDGRSTTFASVQEAIDALAPGSTLPQVACALGPGPDGGIVDPDTWRAIARTLELVWERELDDFIGSEDGNHAFFDLVHLYNLLTGQDTLAVDHIADRSKLPHQWPTTRVWQRYERAMASGAGTAGTP